MADRVELTRLEADPDPAPPAMDSASLVKPKTTLHHAARDNRVELVKQWITILSVADLNKKDSFGFAPLHYAAKFNRFKVLTALIDAGADSNIQTREEKYTPLHFAARYIPRIVNKELQQEESDASARGAAVEVGKLSSSAQAMQYLVNLKKSKKVKINAKAVYGVSALHLACQRGNQAAVSVLLRSNDVIVNIKDDNNDTPLHEACLHGFHDIVENLVTRMKLEDPDNLELDLQNNESQTPLHLACREGHVEVVKTLLRHAGDFKKRVNLTKTVDNEQNTALHLACESGVEEIVSILIVNGAELSAVKLEDVTPMHIAARYGFVNVAVTLMGTGEDLINICQIYNQTPLHYAADHNHVGMIDYLLDCGADITVTDTEAFTPLMIAASAGHVEAFNVLLKRGAAIDDTDENGKTVVHIAAEANHVAILKAVLDNEKDKGHELINSTDSSFNTPLHLAAQKGNIEAVEILLRRSNNTSVTVDAKNEVNKTPTHLAASEGHIAVIEALLKYKGDCILDEDEDGNTPLHLAALHGYRKTVQVLLNFGADFDARNSTLWTPLDCAASKGQEQAVEVLIKAGADVNPTDKQKTTPLHLAAKEGHLNVVKLLLTNNADVGKSASGLNSLDMAIDNGHEDIARVIIQSKHWKNALRNSSVSALGEDTTPLRKLIKKMPEVAEEVFNRCLIGNDSRDGKIRLDSKDYKLTFNYEFLEDFQDKKEGICTRFFSMLTSRYISEVASDSGDTDEASVDLINTKTNVDNVETTKFSMRGYSTNWGPVGFKKKLHPLSIMVQHNRTDLLRHPLVTSLLNLKWGTYGRVAYFSNLFFFIVFVSFLSAFAVESLNPRSVTCVAVHSGGFGNLSSGRYYYDNSTCEFSMNSTNFLINATDLCTNSGSATSCAEAATDIACGRCEELGGTGSVRHIFLFVAASVVIFVAVVRLIFEMFQFITLKHLYVFDWVNWLEIILFVCSIIFASVYQADCLCTTEWQWQVGCIAVFLAWIDLIIFFRKIPLTGIYVLMFVHIFYTFCKMIILTMLLIVAFSLAFYMAFDDPSDVIFARSSFATPGRAVVKTMTMTTGEFEYDSIFRQFPGGAEVGTTTEEIPFPGVSFLLWIIFLVLMPILLTNLLVGLAVDDIKGIQDAAVLKRLALQVELALSVEELLPARSRRYFIREKYTILPNARRHFMDKFRYGLFGSEADRFDSQENISSALHPQATPIEQVQNQTRSLVADMKTMKSTITDLVERNAIMEKLLQEIAKKQNITVDEVQEGSRSFL